MKYEAYVQGNLVKIIEANSTGDALKILATEISNGKISVQENSPHNIKIIPIKNV